MPLRREWMDWKRPLLKAAADWLLDWPTQAGCEDGRCDLSQVLGVVSGRRAGRILLTNLLRGAQERAISLIPPVVVTPGLLVERLLLHQSGEAVANPAESQLAWMAALRELDDRDLRVLAPRRLSADDLGAWRTLADTAARLHSELAGQQLNFEHVAEQAERLEMTGEGDRWRALRRAELRYHQLLHKHSISDVHRAANEALRNEKREAPFEAIVLMGVVDLNATQRLALAPFIDRTIALVHAPPSLTERFDDFGCVNTDAWQDCESPLRDDGIMVAERPGDQAQAVMRVIAGYAGKYAPSQITIGMGDPALVPVVSGHAQWAGVAVRAVGIITHGDTGPHRFLAAVADWLEERRFADFTALLRHPDVDRWLGVHCFPGDDLTRASTARARWLTLLDDYFSEHLQERLDGAWLGSGPQHDDLKHIHQAVSNLLQPLAAIKRQSDLPLGLWDSSILKVLGTLYEDLENAAEVPAVTRRRDACFMLRDALAPIAAAPIELQPTVDASSAIRHVLAAVAEEPVTESIDPSHVEMLGWLELHADAAPALIITGFNEGFIPESVSADAFLPDSLRAMLGLPCNARRYARDMYLLHAILASRPDVTVIAGRATAEGDPLTPSRLLLACDDATLVRRVRQVSHSSDAAESPAPAPPTGLPWPPVDQVSSFVIPTLPGFEIPTSLRVTDFRSYLACPFRFALQRIVGLNPCGEAAAELDAMQFGNLAHEVLQSFSEDPELARSEVVHDIDRFLAAEVERRVKQRFGRRPPPALQVQAAQLKARLRGFSVWQAGHAAQGWRIMHCEHALDDSSLLHFNEPNSPPMPLRGKIDRIDRNERTGEWLVVDYKTGDTGRSPHQSHHGCERPKEPLDTEWIDLQLPLYDYLARQSGLGIAGMVSLGYVVLPKQTDGATLLLADWTTDHINHAIDAAREVVISIRAGRFEINPHFDSAFDSFSRICQTEVFRGDDDADADAGQAEP